MTKTINTVAMTEEQRAAFIKGWENAGGYMGDVESAAPWCAPWYSYETIEVEGETFEEMGADWWRQCEDEVELLIFAEEL